MLPLLLQKADTVVAKLVNPVVVVQRPDTIFAVTPETWVERVSAFSAIAVAFFAVVAIVVEVVREVRRSGEIAREKGARRAAVDGRISALGYALRRQLQSWLDRTNDETAALVQVVDAWAGAAKELGGQPAGEVPGVTDGMTGNTVIWASKGLSDHYDWAEERIVELVAAAPEASAAVAASIRRAYVLFYRGTGRLKRQVATWDYSVGGGSDPWDLVAGYHDLEGCVRELVAAVGPELSQADEELAR